MIAKKHFTQTKAFDALVVALSVAFLIVVGAWLLSMMGCHGNEPTKAEITESSAYGIELQACVAAAKTREESRACRARVDCKWGQGPCIEGGTP